MSYIWDVVTGKYYPPKDTRPSFKGRNVIVTGANVGLGFEAAVKFVELGADKVILAVRTISKGEEAQRQIEARTGRKGVVEVWHLDMLDYTTIKAFSDRASKELDHLDIAVLNAGVVMTSYQESAYGYEQIMQVNVLSTALLALLLMPKLKASKTETYTPVLEIVGSGNIYIVSKLSSETTPFASYNKHNDNMSPQNQYSVSKVFVMYVQAALAQLATTEGGKPDVYVTVVCPGACQSDLVRHVTQWYYVPIVWFMQTFIMRKAEEGARTYISGVTQGEATHGKFWKDDRVKEPAPLLIGEKGKQLQATVWEEIVEALRKDVPEVTELARVQKADKQ